ncbi:hypothetical protein FQN53_000651 [Emmonsiellopsis sp. PD_33]|nr:hypothetical protein FQN53_000651 [Emmonsiellopsis sp. PD_33]
MRRGSKSVLYSRKPRFGYRDGLRESPERNKDDTPARARNILELAEGRTLHIYASEGAATAQPGPSDCNLPPSRLPQNKPPVDHSVSGMISGKLHGLALSWKRDIWPIATPPAPLPVTNESPGPWALPDGGLPRPITPVKRSRNMTGVGEQRYPPLGRLIGPSAQPVVLDPSVRTSFQRIAVHGAIALTSRMSIMHPEPDEGGKECAIASRAARLSL